MKAQHLKRHRSMLEPPQNNLQVSDHVLEQSVLQPPLVQEEVGEVTGQVFIEVPSPRTHFRPNPESHSLQEYLIPFMIKLKLFSATEANPWNREQGFLTGGWDQRAPWQAIPFRALIFQTSVSFAK